MTQRIVYGQPEHVPALSELSPEQVGGHLRAAGCDSIFLHDPDHSWVTGLHSAGLRVYASLGIFAGRGLWERFPQSRPITADGTPAPREDWYEPAIPTLPELRAQRLRELETLAQSAPLDGVWLDFIRWPARWERPQPRLYHSSFDPVTLRQFQADSGVRLPADATTPAEAAQWILTHAADAWFAWRCQQIASFVADARARLKRHRPDALLGMFTVPWTDDDFDQAILRIVGQDPARLAPYVDVFSPMVYHRMCGRDPSWIGHVTQWTATRTERTVWPIIEAVEPAPAYPASEFAAACRTAASASGSGVIVFKLEGLLSDPARIEVWQRL